MGDDLDAEEYSPVGHLNAVFLSSGGLGRLNEVQDTVALYQSHLDCEIAKEVELTDGDQQSLERTLTAPQQLAALLQEVDGLKSRAHQCEEGITGMTADIKKLDSTKANLITSITILKRLQMLTTAYDQLVRLIESRQYREMAQTLPAVMELMSHFKSFRSIDQIAVLSKRVADVQTRISTQIFEDFARVVGPEAGSRPLPGYIASGLGDACLVLDSLTGGANYREQLTTWYCNVVLKEYHTIFGTADEAGSLDNISRRYAYLKRLLKKHTDDHEQYFAEDWHITQELTKRFCATTRDDIAQLLRQAGRDIDVQLLLNALQETLEFESYLEKKVGVKGQKMFEKSISSAFQPHLNIWVEYQDKVLSSKFAKYRAPPVPEEEPQEKEPTVLPSSADLFVFYKQTLAQTAKLSTGPPLLDLSNLFGKWLSLYSSSILKPMIPGSPRLTSDDDLRTVCLVLNTADYCKTTTDQLANHIINQLDEEIKDQATLDSQQDAFNEIINICINSLVADIEIACDQAWREMVNTNWRKLETVGDQSGYVSELKRALESESSRVLNAVLKPVHIRFICDKVVDGLTVAFLNNVVACRPISAVSAEQMLLDLYVLKSVFLSLPKKSPEDRVSASYTRHVSNSLSRIETILKVILTQADPPEGLVQNYLYCVGDSSVGNFVKILQLKGVARQEIPRFTGLFNSHLKAHDNLSKAWPILTNLNMNDQTYQSQSHYMPATAAVSSSLTANNNLRFDAQKVFGGITKENIEKSFERFAHDAAPVSKFNDFKRFFNRREGSSSPSFSK
ncbi:vacuolar protein sorting-associated protein 53 [Trichomonascus vanleenenianus]|uniref:Vps53p n=1 Tax=Trichomonascus vanleenenianus TaxID=2268995 RepID=UPI003ECB51AD